MNQNEGSTHTGAGSSSNSSEDFVRQEKRAAEGLVDDAKVAATEALAEGKKLASDKAEDLQEVAATHLKTFAEAVRAAGDTLADKEPGLVSDLVRQAAEGLEGFSGALGRKSSTEMIESVRDFGRQNPAGFFAGSLLAGFAVARFASSGATPRKTYPAGSGNRPFETPTQPPETASSATGYAAQGERRDTPSPMRADPSYDPLDPVAENPLRDQSLKGLRGAEV